MKNILVMVFVICSFASNAQYKSMNEAINYAGKQRMLSQRIAKSFLMIASDIQIDKYQQELDHSMAEFGETHYKLKKYFADDEKVNAEMEKVERIWFNFRETANSHVYTKIKCNSILNFSTFLLEATQNVMNTLTNSSKSKIEKIVDKSGSLRMLSQKIGVYYVASHLKLPTENIEGNFDDAIKVLDQRLSELKSANTVNTEEINSKLKRASIDWSFVKKSLKLEKNLKPATIGVTLDTFMMEMDEITGLYAKIPSPK
ncbi:type IV pili methyl-accepting chemotaxis transducer N-terminal domain-containing protein [Aquimarina rhabdastrellae]